MAPSSVPEAEEEFFGENIPEEELLYENGPEVNSSDEKMLKAAKCLKDMAKEIENKQQAGVYSTSAATELERKVLGLKRWWQNDFDSQVFKVQHTLSSHCLTAKIRILSHSCITPLEVECLEWAKNAFYREKVFVLIKIKFSKQMRV